MLPQRARPGVFLGYSTANGCWLIGYWKQDGRVKSKSGLRFDVYEHWKVRFDQSIVIANIDDLKQADSFIRVRYPLYSSLRDVSMTKPPMALADGVAPVSVVPGSSNPISRIRSKDVHQPVRDWLEADVHIEDPHEVKS